MTDSLLASLEGAELVDRLSEVRADHLRLASWNAGRDKPKRAAFHYDAVNALDSVIRILRATQSRSTPEDGGA